MVSALVEYRLRESNNKRLSPVWGIVHITCFGFSACLSFVAFVTFENVQGLFEGPCFLFADLIFGNSSGKEVELVTSSKSAERTTWGPMTNCAIFQFMTALQIIFGCLLSAMFCCIGPEEYKIFRSCRTWQLILPGLCSSGLLLLVSALTLATYSQGFEVICSSITNGLFLSSCYEIREYTIPSKPKLHWFPYPATAVLVASWGSLLAWAISFGSLLARCCVLPDFEVPTLPDQSFELSSCPSTAETPISSFSSASRTRRSSQRDSSRKSRRKRTVSTTGSCPESDTCRSVTSALPSVASEMQTYSAHLASPETSLSASLPVV